MRLHLGYREVTVGDSTLYFMSDADEKELSQPPWLPPRRAIRVLPAGRDWDAVRVPRSIGERVLAKLGADTGAVIADSMARLLYWLVRVGAADDWELPPGRSVFVRTSGTYVAVPGPLAISGPVWRIPVSANGVHTDAERLRTILEAELSPVDLERGHRIARSGETSTS